MIPKNQQTIRHRLMRYVLGGVDKDIWNWEPNYSFLRKPDVIHRITLPENSI